MLYLIPATVVACIAAYLLGYYMRGLAKKIEQLEDVIKSKVDKKPVKQEPTSIIIDPLDEVAEAKHAHDLMMKRLNPDE